MNVETHCGRWLINKHLTNPLRNLGRRWTNSQDVPYSISVIRSGLIRSSFPGGKMHLTWTTLPAGTSWLTPLPPPPPSQLALHIHSWIKHHPTCSNQNPRLRSIIDFLTEELLRNNSRVHQTVGLLEVVMRQEECRGSWWPIDLWLCTRDFQYLFSTYWWRQMSIRWSHIAD